VAKAREVLFVMKTLVRNKYPERLVENIEKKRRNKRKKDDKPNKM
jgi:hypothetical protein